MWILHQHKTYIIFVKMSEDFQNFSDIVWSAVFSSLTTVCLPYPVDLIRTQQQANVLKHYSLSKGFQSIYHKYGLRGLYKGLMSISSLQKSSKFDDKFHYKFP